MQNKNLKFTRDQVDAIDSLNTPGSIEAGAGSGKTTVLVNRTIDILEKNNHLKPENVLLITFTENAVGDIKKKLMEKFDDKSSVFTFHGFFNQILREYPSLAGLDPLFTIMDETRTKIFYEKTLIDFITSQNNPEIYDYNKILSENLAFVLTHFTPQSLLELILKLYNERHLFYLKKDITSILNEYKTLSFGDIINKISLQIKSNVFFKESIENIKTILPLDPSDKLYALSKEYLAIAMDIEKFLHQQNIPLPPLRGGSEKNYKNDDFKTIKTSLSFIKKLLLELSNTSFDPKRNSLSFDLTKSILVVFEGFEKHLTYRKEKNNFLDFSDLELFASKISEHPFIKNHYNMKYKYILIDEFQDTSIIQKKFIYSFFPLKKIVVVGDPKQSIYKFRNADVSLFWEVTADIAREGKKMILNKNFRSKPNLLFFFNTVFENLLSHNHTNSNLEKEKIISCLSNMDAPKILPQSLWEIEDQSTNRGQIDIISYTPNQSPIFEYESKIVCKSITDLISKGEQFKDITILLHSTTHLKEIEASLKKQNIPYYVYESRGYFEKFEIYDIINLIKFLFNTNDDIALLATLKSSFCCLNDQSLLSINEFSSYANYFEKFKEYVIKKEKFSDIYNFLTKARELILSIPLYYFVEEIIENTNYKKAICSSDFPHQRKANIEKFLTLIAAHEKEEPLISKMNWILFFDKLKNMDLSIGEARILEDNDDCVRLMTVHKSKGLEFKNVIIPYAGSNQISKPSNFLFNKNLPTVKTYEDEQSYENILHFLSSKNHFLEDAYESIRLFYVAMTRAKSNITIIGGLSKKPKSFSLYSSWMDHIDNILKFSDTPSGTYIHRSKISYLDGDKRISREIEFYYNYTEYSDEIILESPFEISREKSSRNIPKAYHEKPLKGIDKISAISLQHYKNCSHYYFLRYEMKIPENFSEKEKITPKNLKKTTNLKSAEKGKIIHKLFEKFAIKDFGENEIENNIHEISSYFGYSLSKEDGHNLFLESALSFKSDYFNFLRTSLKTFTEHPFLLKLNSTIKGTIDRFDLWKDQVVITDYKTGLRSNTENDQNKYDIQAKIYALAISKLYPKIPITFNFFFTNSQNCLTQTFKNDDLPNIENEINELIYKITNNIFIKNRNNCKFCPMQNVCSNNYEI